MTCTALPVPAVTGGQQSQWAAVVGDHSKRCVRCSDEEAYETSP